MTALRRGTARRFGLRKPPVYATGGVVGELGALGPEWIHERFCPALSTAQFAELTRLTCKPAPQTTLVFRTSPETDRRFAQKLMAIIRQRRIGGAR